MNEPVIFKEECSKCGIKQKCLICSWSHPYALCGNCTEAFRPIFNEAVSSMLVKFIQPERLNPEASQEDAIV